MYFPLYLQSRQVTAWPESLSRPRSRDASTSRHVVTYTPGCARSVFLPLSLFLSFPWPLPKTFPLAGHPYHLCFGFCKDTLDMRIQGSRYYTSWTTLVVCVGCRKEPPKSSFQQLKFRRWKLNCSFPPFCKSGKQCRACDMFRGECLANFARSARMNALNSWARLINRDKHLMRETMNNLSAVPLAFVSIAGFVCNHPLSLVLTYSGVTPRRVLSIPVGFRTRCW